MKRLKNFSLVLRLKMQKMLYTITDVPDITDLITKIIDGKSEK